MVTGGVGGGGLEWSGVEVMGGPQLVLPPPCAGYLLKAPGGEVRDAGGAAAKLRRGCLSDAARRGI